MRKDIPEFLIEMSKNMNIQDNRTTADPIWMVCFDEPHVCPEGYDEYYEVLETENDYKSIYSSKGGADNSGANLYLWENYKEWCEQWVLDRSFSDDFERLGEEGFFMENYCFSEDEYPDCVDRFYMATTMKVVKACLTESDAKAFIARKQHDYVKLYTYVYSMCYCPEMIALRGWIMGITD